MEIKTAHNISSFAAKPVTCRFPAVLKLIQLLAVLQLF